jgi:transcriptional regulator with XRE-family HTH domain
MKKKEKIEAIRLRKEKGLSVNEIARIVGVSKGTASLWLRDIELSEEHKKRLALRNPAKCKQASKVWQKKCREKRSNSQEIGRNKAKLADRDFAFGIALYAGEGDKSRNVVAFSNTDKFLIKSFFDFINSNFDVELEEWKIAIHCYRGNKFSVEEIEKFWVRLLGLDISNLTKTFIKNGYYDGAKKAKYPYGVCRISLYRTDIKQELFGAIKEIVGDGSDRWLD